MQVSHKNFIVFHLIPHSFSILSIFFLDQWQEIHLKLWMLRQFFSHIKFISLNCNIKMYFT